MKRSKLKEAFQVGMESYSKESLLGSAALVDDVLFTQLKERAINTPDEDIDSSILELIKTINSIPYLATVWSCSGNPKDHSSVSGKVMAYPYIVLVGEKSKVNEVDDFISHLMEKSWSEILPFDEVILGFLDSLPIEGWSSEYRYPVVTLTWDNSVSKNDIRRTVKLISQIKRLVK